MKEFKTSLFLFRRDLRLEDNTALLEACRQSELVIPIFIFDPRQIERKNAYRSAHAIQFMLQSLRELDQTLQKRGAKLHYFSGKSDEVISKLLRKQKIEAIFFNRDYTPFARKRDQKLKELSDKEGAVCLQYPDVLLTEPEQVQNGVGKPYQVFTPFMRAASGFPVRKPKANHYKNFAKMRLSGELSASQVQDIQQDKNRKLFQKGGRNEALAILRKLSQFDSYKLLRDFPAEHGTTGLSAHNKFGTISIREFYHAVVSQLGSQSTLLTELYWRDFYTHIAFHFPHVFGGSFHEKYDRLQWNRSKKDFSAWCGGKTGFPIVDAGMRQLNQTGWMHNRVRMIVASFLTKDLYIDWRWGEKYFAQQLVDYDPAVNNGSWQWAASTGTDAQPYFRIFNPWLQQKKFDPEAKYIKHWVPELAKLEANTIHRLMKSSPENLKYPAPLVDHGVASARTKAAFKQIG